MAAAFVPSHIKSKLKHPMLASVKTWALAHLLSNGDLGSILLFGSFLAWGVYARIAAKRRGDLGAADRARRLDQRRHRRGASASSSISRSAIVFHPYVDRRAGVRESKRHVGAKRNQAADRARHPRAQGRRADRLPDLLSRAHRAHRRQTLRRDPGRRLARHGDARARDHGAGHARHDDPARPRGDARLASARWSWSTCRSAPTRPRRSRPS